ncbi:MAG: calcium/sodium antiporter [Phototrophicaceae bacterium]
MWIFLGLASGLLMLLFGGDWLVKSASNLASSLGISPLIIGLTVVAFGTSTPELLVSVNAALSGLSDIAVGNIVGSNIANIGLILGLSGLIYPIQVHVNLLKREIPIMIVVAIVSFLMFLDQFVGRVDGLILLMGLFGFITFMIVSSQREKGSEVATNESEQQAKPPIEINRLYEILRLLLGIAVLMFGAQLTVNNATELARSVGISELVIGVTLVAVGTSLPELVTSVMAAIRQESDIAIGNVVGSNIFNILGILGITAIIQPINVAIQTVRVDAIVMIIFSVLLMPFVLDRKLGRIEATSFLMAYIGFTIYTVFMTT